MKKTCAQRETLPIAGFALKKKKFDGIYVGRRKGKNLIYAGKVDHGFDTTSAKELQARLKPLIRKTPPYAEKIAHRGIWVEPSLLAEIEYRAKSAKGKVRHPFLQGHPGGLVNTAQLARRTAIAIGATFVVVAGVYLILRLVLFAL